MIFPSHSTCNLSISSYGDCITVHVLLLMIIQLIDNVILTFFQGLAVSFALFVFCMDTDFKYIGVSNWAFFFTLLINSLNELIGQFYLHLTSTSSGVATL